MEHIDLLSIAGIDPVEFNATENVKLVSEEDREQYGRVFRKNGKLVFRAGTAIDWYGDDDTTSRRH